ncbi:MFS transporter [Streptosporangium soli]
MLFFALSWGGGVLLGEMFPNRIRAAALGVAAAAQWLASWLISVSFPALAEWNLPLTYAGTPSWRCCRSSSSPDGSGRPRPQAGGNGLTRSVRPWCRAGAGHHEA